MNLLEEEIKVQIKISIWPSQIPDLAKFLFGPRHIYRIYPKYSNRRTLANSADPNQTPQNAASDQDLHSLLLVQ